MINLKVLLKFYSSCSVPFLVAISYKPYPSLAREDGRIHMKTRYWLTESER